MSQTITYTFDTTTNYTYDSSLIDHSAGSFYLKDLTPTSSTFYGEYSTDINGNYGNGNLTGTASGGAAITNSALDLTGLSGKKVVYSAIGNADSAQTLCARMNFEAGYLNFPASNSYFFSINRGDTTLNNVVQITHLATGVILFQVYDSAASPIFNASLATWTATAGNHELEINVDITNGVSAAFMDGIQLGATQAAVGTRISSSITTLVLGCSHDCSNTSDIIVNSFLVFDTVQHTANYTPFQSISSTRFSTSNPTIEASTSFTHEGLESYSETSSISGSDEIKAILKRGSDYYWYSGGWTVSTDTYTASNTDDEINTNASTFTDNITTTNPKWFLHSDDGSTSPRLDEIVINYDFAGETRDTIEYCTVWGYNLQPDGTVDEGTVTANINGDVFKYKTNVTIRKEQLSDVPDASNGYWEIKAVETSNMTTTARYVFEMNNKKYLKQIPNTETANFWNLEA